jgi:hypothetical protein
MGRNSLERHVDGNGHVTQDYLREYFRYEDGNMYAIKTRPRSKVKVGDLVGYEKNGRIMTTIFGRKYGLHQIVWIYHNGKLPEYGIDHKDRQSWNNKIGNLRPCTAASNAQNQEHRLFRMGVRPVGLRSWLAIITKDGVIIRLGTFHTYEEACAARDKAEKELFPYSPLNGE